MNPRPRNPQNTQQAMPFKLRQSACFYLCHFRGRGRSFPFRGRGRGVTLVEMLAVLVMLSAVGVLTLSGLGRADEQARLHRFAAQVQRLDQLARMECAQQGMVELAVDHEHNRIVLRDVDPDVVMRDFSIPTGVTLEMCNAAGKSIHTVTINRPGRSVDYSVQAKTDGHKRSWSVAGLTGFIMRERGSDD